MCVCWSDAPWLLLLLVQRFFVNVSVPTNESAMREEIAVSQYVLLYIVAVFLAVCACLAYPMGERKDMKEQFEGSRSYCKPRILRWQFHAYCFVRAILVLGLNLLLIKVVALGKLSAGNCWLLFLLEGVLLIGLYNFMLLRYRRDARDHLAMHRTCPRDELPPPRPRRTGEILLVGVAEEMYEGPRS